MTTDAEFVAAIAALQGWVGRERVVEDEIGLTAARRIAGILDYGPSPTEVEHARRLIAAFDVALAEGKGAVAFEGAMIELPVVERARRLLARAR